MACPYSRHPCATRVREPGLATTVARNTSLILGTAGATRSAVVVVDQDLDAPIVAAALERSTLDATAEPGLHLRFHLIANIDNIKIDHVLDLDAIAVDTRPPLSAVGLSCDAD